MWEGYPFLQYNFCCHSEMVNPHQRCGYSDSPFARRDTFLYCRLQKWVGGEWTPVGIGWHHTQKEVVPKKKTRFCYQYGKICWGRQAGGKTRPGSAGIDNEASWSCKRRVTETLMNMTQFGSKITKIKVSTFWIPEIRCFPAGGQCQPSH